MPIVRPLALPASLALIAALAACQRSPADDTAAATTTAPASGVAREAVLPSPTPVATPVAAAIQTQPGPKGTQVSLNRVAVTGDIMTVSLTYNGGTCCIYTPVEQISVIDDATAQRIGVLKDNAGNWMAAPIYSDNKQIRIDPGTTGAQVWFKFPAPPATSKTVSIAVPEVAPFDAVPVTR